MSGATKGFISYTLIGKRTLIKPAPIPQFRMVDGTYAQNGLGVTGVRTPDMSSA